MMMYVAHLLTWILSAMAPALAYPGVHGSAPQEQQQGSEEDCGYSGQVPDPAALRQRIAAAQVLMRADGDYAQAGTLLRQSWLESAASQGFQGQEEALVLVALARAELFSNQGMAQEALQATQRLLPRKQDFARLQEQQLQLEVANKALRIAALEALKDARLIELRKKLEQDASGGGKSSLEAIVFEAYAESDFDRILEIGAPAQAAFGQAIVADADAFPQELTWDPIYYLLAMNERRAAEILLENIDAGGYLWKRRIVRAMDGRSVMNNRGTWSSEAPYICLEPEWLGVIEALLSSPDTALQSVHMVQEPFLRDQLTPGVQRALVHGIETLDLDFVNAVLQALDFNGVVESALPVFEAAARRKEPAVRRFAARMLSNYEVNPTLLGMAADADEEVRASVVKVLRPYTGQWIKREQSANVVVNLSRRSYEPQLGEDERALLRVLSADPSARIRTSAAHALYNLDVPLEDEVYLRLAADEETEVRTTVAWISRIDDDLRSRILTLLAMDSSKDVLEAVDDVLNEAPLQVDPTPYLGALRLRLLDRAVPMEHQTRYRLVGHLIRTPAGMRSLVATMLESDDRPLQDLLFERVQSHEYRCLLGLDDQALAEVFVRVHDYEDGSWSHFLRNTLDAIRSARPSRRGAMRAVARNPVHGLPIRLAAARIAAPDGGEVFLAQLELLARDGYWSAGAVTDEDLSSFAETVSALPGEQANAFVLAIVRDATIHDDLARSVAGSYLATEPLGREVTLAVLARWFTPEAGYVYPVKLALRHLASLSEDADSALLRAAALNPNYAMEAIETMIALHREEFLPTLEVCMGARQAARGDDPAGIRYAATNAVSTYFSDAAAEILLRGLASSDPSVRNRCMAGLDYIESTRERTRRWEELKQGQPTKESALAELLVMLDDEHQEIRIQAVRGIATFGAVEYLPTLIRLLKDPNGEMVVAARAAIETLSQRAAAGSSD